MVKFFVVHSGDRHAKTKLKLQGYISDPAPRLPSMPYHSRVSDIMKFCIIIQEEFFLNNQTN